MKSGWNGVSSRSGSARRVSAQASGSVAIPKSQPSTFAVVKSGSPSAYRPATKKVQDGFVQGRDESQSKTRPNTS